jgi:hypothetical protein
MPRQSTTPRLLLHLRGQSDKLAELSEDIPIPDGAAAVLAAEKLADKLEKLTVRAEALAAEPNLFGQAEAGN